MATIRICSPGHGNLYTAELEQLLALLVSPGGEFKTIPMLITPQDQRLELQSEATILQLAGCFSQAEIAASSAALRELPERLRISQPLRLAAMASHASNTAAVVWHMGRWPPSSTQASTARSNAASLVS